MTHWFERAACRDQAPRFDAVIEGESDRQRKERHAAAVLICWTCPVLEQCRAHRDPARDFEVMAGHPAPVRPNNVPSGGGSGDVTRKQGRPQTPIVHSTVGGYRAHHRIGERPCTPCYEAERRYRADRRAARRAS